MPSEVDLAYLAGQIDADGSICLTKNVYALTVQVSLYSQDVAMLTWVQETFDGSVSVCGRVLVWKPKNRVPFLELILPYLRTKRPQAELAIESRQWRSTPEVIAEYVAKSKELNGRLPKAFPKSVQTKEDT